MSNSFQSEIGELAERARDESVRNRDSESGPTSRRSRLSKIVGGGLVLAALGLGSLAVMHGMQRAEITTESPAPHPLLADNTCRGEVYRTYRRIIRYVRANGSRPPASLAEVMQPGEPLPADPKNGRSLVYSTDGERFSLVCP